jgi:hypothetical protein
MAIPASFTLQPGQSITFGLYDNKLPRCGCGAMTVRRANEVDDSCIPIDLPFLEMCHCRAMLAVRAHDTGHICYRPDKQGKVSAWNRVIRVATGPRSFRRSRRDSKTIVETLECRHMIRFHPGVWKPAIKRVCEEEECLNLYTRRIELHPQRGLLYSPLVDS